MPSLDRITIYPVKSLDGLDVEVCDVLPSGALEHDRRWQLVDDQGRVVNAKRTGRFHAIRAGFDLARRTVSLARAAGPAAEFPLVPGPAGPAGWLSEALGVAVSLVERVEGGFPDDRDAPGPTLVSTASLAAVAGWFALDLAECRRRFRANLEISGCDAFWEDALASPAPRGFAIGSARFQATNVCRRCVVPTRDSRSGEVTALFREVFEARRRTSLRADVAAAAWGTLYRLGINTRAATVHRPGLVMAGADVSTC